MKALEVCFRVDYYHEWKRIALVRLNSRLYSLMLMHYPCFYVEAENYWLTQGQLYK